MFVFTNFGRNAGKGLRPELEENDMLMFMEGEI
jgi:hypothetical protein